MNGRAFYKMVMADPDLELMRCVEGGDNAPDFVEVRFLPFGGGTRISVEEILRAEAADLKAVMRFERAPEILRKFNATGCAVEHAAALQMITRVASAA